MTNSEVWALLEDYDKILTNAVDFAQNAKDENPNYARVLRRRCNALKRRKELLYAK